MFYLRPPYILQKLLLQSLNILITLHDSLYSTLSSSFCSTWKKSECLFVSKFNIVPHFVNHLTVVWLTTLLWSMMTFWKSSELSVLILLFLKFHLCECLCLFSTWLFISSATGSGVFDSGFRLCSITAECATSLVWPCLETDWGT